MHKRRVAVFGLVLSVIASLAIPVLQARAAPTCKLLIDYIQTQSASGDEQHDSLSFTNYGDTSCTASATNPIVVQYIASTGIIADSMTITRSVLAGQSLIYSSDPSVRQTNADVLNLPLGLYSGGGSLYVSRTVSGVTTHYDAVSWGNAKLAPGGAPLDALTPGQYYARAYSNGLVQDTKINRADFSISAYTCRDVAVHELQPRAVNGSGAPLTPWFELVAQASPTGPCVVQQAGGLRFVAEQAVLPPPYAFATYDVTNDSSAPNSGLGSGGGQVWLGSAVAYGIGRQLFVPIDDSGVFGALDEGQTWSRFVDGWQATYEPTPDEPNILRTVRATPDEEHQWCANVRITELLPNPDGADEGQEWIELYNQGTASQSLAHCSIRVDTTVYGFGVHDSLDANTYMVVRSMLVDDTLEDITLPNSALTYVAFERRLSNDTTELIQSMQYNDAPDGQSYTRLIDGWAWQLPTPLTENTALPPPRAEPIVTENPVPLPAVGVVMPIDITELLPNPAAPKTDAVDEYVELYNPGDAAVSLRGYRIETGSSFGSGYTFSEEIIAPKSYLIVTSGSTGISLSNTAGAARLLGPDGSVISQADAYNNAPEGGAWAKIDGVWRWTTAATPATNNAFVPIVPRSASTKAVTAVAKPKTSTTKAVKAAQTTKAPKTPKATTTTAATTTDTPPPVHVIVLIGVGLLVVGYAAFEYRQDIANWVHRIRARRS